MKKLLPGAFTGVLVFSLLIISPVMAGDSTYKPGLPAAGASTIAAGPFRPLLPPHAFTPSSPVPENQMVRVSFDLDWILKNDADPDAYNVRITFPMNWISLKAPVPGDIAPVELRVPIQLLIENDTDRNPDTYTVSLPNYYFTGLPAAPLPTQFRFPEAEGVGLVLGNCYSERITYGPAEGDDITGARGRIRPLECLMPQEDLLVYQEVEFYADTEGDAVEVISWMEQSHPEPVVMFVIYSDGEAVQLPACSCCVPLGATVNYEFVTRSEKGYTACFLQAGNEWYYGAVSDTTSATHYVNFKGACELYNVATDGETFSINTSPISIEGLYTGTWRSGPYVAERLELWHADADLDYVEITCHAGVTGIYFAARAGN